MKNIVPAALFRTNVIENNGGIHQNALEYQALTDVNVYDSSKCLRLATQAKTGRHLRIPSANVAAVPQATEIRLCEDGYYGWVSAENLNNLKTTEEHYQAAKIPESEIRARISGVLEYAHLAIAQPNRYLWGGTLGPHYDCSGFMQAAFASVGIWIPRDAYQQEAFSHPIRISELEPGDLLFFGSERRATHVGLCIRSSEYMHSSGRDHGRDGIGIDQLSLPRDKTSQWLFDKLRCAGRITENFRPKEA